MVYSVYSKWKLVKLKIVVPQTRNISVAPIIVVIWIKKRFCKPLLEKIRISHYPIRKHKKSFFSWISTLSVHIKIITSMLRNYNKLCLDNWILFHKWLSISAIYYLNRSKSLSYTNPVLKIDYFFLIKL